MEPIPIYNDVILAKKLSENRLQLEYKKLKEYKVNNAKMCNVGNKILHHFQIDNLCRVKNAKGSFYEWMVDEEKRKKLFALSSKYSYENYKKTPCLRMFECYRRTIGAFVFFRPNIAINVYDYCSATSILDPCAGWGGRMLAAMVKNINYTGIDTNTDLRLAYDEMMKFETQSSVKMIWEDCLKVDFSQIDYDCVLTSPPYFTLEIYPHMQSWVTKDIFYDEFLIPLINKCRAHIRRNGKVCINISPSMYKQLIKRGYDSCKSELPMIQRTIRDINKKDKIYIW